jgi:hypothetical protein
VMEMMWQVPDVKHDLRENVAHSVLIWVTYGLMICVVVGEAIMTRDWKGVGAMWLYGGVAVSAVMHTLFVLVPQRGMMRRRNKGMSVWWVVGVCVMGAGICVCGAGVLMRGESERSVMSLVNVVVAVVSCLMGDMNMWQEITREAENVGGALEKCRRVMLVIAVVYVGMQVCYFMGVFGYVREMMGKRVVERVVGAV